MLRDLPSEVAVLSAVAFCVALGFGILAPALPVFARTFDVTALQASAVISVFALVRFVTSPVSGVMVDRWGERIVLATGLAPILGFEKASAVALKSVTTGKTIQSLCEEEGLLSEEELATAADPFKMTAPRARPNPKT